MALASVFAPMIRMVSGLGRRSSNCRVIQLLVRLCRTTVEMMTEKTSGTSLSASVTRFSSRLRANTELTAAATIPRGAIQLSSSFSLNDKPERMVERKIQNGRAINCTTIISNNTIGPNCQRSPRLSRAASRINRAEIRIIDKSSLNSRIASISRSS